MCSIELLFCGALSPAFYVLYILAGLTDMADGWVARRTHTASEFGARWDTAADLIFVAVCLTKLIPVMRLPLWLSIWIGIIAGIKLFNIAYGYVARKRFVAMHSPMNKATGLLLFLFPLTWSLIDYRISAVVVCSAATFAAIQEGLLMKSLIPFATKPSRKAQIFGRFHDKLYLCKRKKTLVKILCDKPHSK